MISNLPTLRILPLESLLLHEDHDSQRSQPLVEKLRAQGVLRNPPIVMPLMDRSHGYMVLDGANRVTSLRELEFPHIVAQVVEANNPNVNLQTWNHVIWGMKTKTLMSRLRKIKELVAEGVTVVGSPALKSPSLSGYPACDAEVKRLVAELWGEAEAPAQLTALPHGKGRLYWGGEFKRPAPASAAAAQTSLGLAKWIWRAEGNPAVSAPPGKRFFRRAFELESAPVRSGRLVMTADNAFECRVNGQVTGSGDNWSRTYEELNSWIDEPTY